jgi:hypothetical protein
LTLGQARRLVEERPRRRGTRDGAPGLDVGDDEITAAVYDGVGRGARAAPGGHGHLDGSRRHAVEAPEHCRSPMRSHGVLADGEDGRQNVLVP